MFILDTFFSIPSFPYLYLCPPRFLQVWNPHKTTADWRLFSRVHGGGASVMHWAHPKLSRPTNSSSLRSWDITTHVTANGPHPVRVCARVCVIRPLTSIWPDLSFPGFLPHPTSPLFVTLIQYALLPLCSTLLLLSCTHTHTRTCKC